MKTLTDIDESIVEFGSKVVDELDEILNLGVLGFGELQELDGVDHGANLFRVWSFFGVTMDASSDNFVNGRFETVLRLREDAVGVVLLISEGDFSFKHSENKHANTEDIGLGRVLLGIDLRGHVILSSYGSLERSLTDKLLGLTKITKLGDELTVGLDSDENVVELQITMHHVS